MKKFDKKKEERIERLINLSNKYDVNAYQMWLKSDKKISQPTFYDFLNRKRVPNDSTLEIIENIIMEFFISPEEKENQKNTINYQEISVLEKLDLLLSKIEKLDMKQDIMFEILKNGIISSAEVVIKSENRTLSNS